MLGGELGIEDGESVTVGATLEMVLGKELGSALDVGKPLELADGVPLGALGKALGTADGVISVGTALGLADGASL